MKWDASLKKSGEMTEAKLMVTCRTKNMTKKRPESAITYFRASEDFMSPLIRLWFCTKLRHDQVFNKFSTKEPGLFRSVLSYKRKRLIYEPIFYGFPVKS